MIGKKSLKRAVVEMEGRRPPSKEDNPSLGEAAIMGIRSPRFRFLKRR